MKKLGFAIIAVALVTASGAMARLGPWVSENLAMTKGMSVSGPAFNQALHKEYVALGEEALAESDHLHARRYVAKGYHAGSGKNVMPENPRTWWLPSRSRDELYGWYPKLLKALDYRNNRVRKPAVAARAQAMYDCWVEEEHEDVWWRSKPMYQPDDIARCKNAFIAAYNELMRADNDINFKFNRPLPGERATRAVLWPGGAEPRTGYSAPSGVESLDALIGAAKGGGSAVRVNLIGHTDTVGGVNYNKILSERRALFIRNRLVAGGIAAPSIRYFGEGKTKPKFNPGKDQARDVRNRRVEWVLGQ
jgi:OOP family OmpA-OmpF porin